MLLALIVLAAAPAVTGNALTLEEAVAVALRESPQIDAAHAGERIAAARERRATAMWLPEVSVREAWTRGNNPVFVFGSLLEQGRFGAAQFDPAFLNAPPSLTNWRQSLAVRYPLFDQLRRVTRIAQSRAAVTQAGKTSNAAQQELRLRVIRAYFGLALARERAGVAADALKSAEADADAIRAGVDAGLLARSELLAAEVQTAELRQQKIEADGELAIALATLNLLLRQPLANAIAPATALPERAFTAPSLDDALQRGASNRPELERARLESGNARLELRAARGSLLPRVDAFADIGASGATFSQRNSDHTAGVMLTWSLLDPNRTGRIAEARAAADAARDAETSAADAVQLEIVGAWHRYDAAREKLDVGQRSVAHAEEAARIVRDRYEQGLTTITEQLRAQTALVRARMLLLAATFDTTTGFAELLRAMGGLHDVAPFL